MKSAGLAGVANKLKRATMAAPSASKDSTASAAIPVEIKKVEKVLWTYDVFLDRLAHMRDVRRGLPARGPPFNFLGVPGSQVTRLPLNSAGEEKQI